MYPEAANYRIDQAGAASYHDFRLSSLFNLIMLIMLHLAHKFSHHVLYHPPDKFPSTQIIIKARVIRM